MEVYPDLKEFIELLNENGVEYLVVGGYAALRIDLITELVGLKFSKAYKNLIEGTFGDIKNVKYISSEDLITNKTLSGRKQDLFDVDWIKKYRTKKRKK